jgi:hypothetical protein
MASLKTKILLIFLLVKGLSLMGQPFTYSYIDPCTKEIKLVYADMSAPIVIAYYGEVKAFTYDQLQDGTFDNWINNIYIKYQSMAPCQGVLVTTTTTTSTNQVSNIIGNVMNLTSLDFSSVSNVGAGVGSSVGSTTNSGTNVSTSQSKKNENSDGGSSTDQSTSSNGNSGSGSGDAQGSGSSSSSSSSSSGSGSASGSGSGSGSGDGAKTEEPKTEKPSEQKIEDQKTETQKAQSTSSAKAASKAKVETSKPAILMTGDIVGIQTKSNGAQDARATMSFTRVKGDGTASIGLSADYMVNAKIGNVSGVKSWIGTNQKGNKHINVASVGVGLMPDALSSTALFVRVNSLKHFTALYGAAGTYGQLFGEELISTIVIGGCMYKGKVTKALDATIIMAGIYSPYSKYYTESILNFKPIVIPFINLNYKLTKTFGIGLTGGGTYVAGKDVLNFQILMGAKLKL